MAVLNTENAMRNTTRVAKRERFAPGATDVGGTIKSTNVQDAINEVAAAGGGGPSGGATVTISDTAPVSPSAGNLWWNSALGQMYIYFNDGSSSQWVAITTAQALGSGGGIGGGGSGSPGSFTTNILGAGTYLVPSGKTTLIGEAWGGGGGGTGTFSSGTGGGGAGYSKFSTTVTPGQTIYFFVGAGGGGAQTNNALTGQNSWVNPTANSQPTSNGCVGNGGGFSGLGGFGGGAIGTIGTTNFQGGNGGSTAGTGGGGGGAGSAGNGGNGTSTTGGAGGSPDGGAGSAFGTPPITGSVPGGGGGAYNGSGTGGTGGQGQIRLTFS